jgi:regulator of sigma E protease
MLGIIIGIAIFMFLVIIHELGHFTAAKLSGVKVLEFGVGIPPKLKKLRQDKSGTEYTLNRIPLGWFVRLKGENPNDPSFLAPDSFITANIVKKIIILIAGVTVNAVFAYLAFVYLFASGTRPLIVIPENMSNFDNTSFFINSTDRLQTLWLLSGDTSALPVQIDTVFPESLAATIGLQTGDIIQSINNTKVDTNTIWPVLKSFVNQDFNIQIQRNKAIVILPARCPEDNCFLGISMQGGWAVEILEYKVPFTQALWLARHEIGAQFSLTFQWLGNLWSKLFSFDKEKVQEGVSSLSGPVWAVKIADDIRQSAGRKALLAFAAMISMWLAIFNILPIPALDGGRILGVLIQRISRMKAEKYFLIESYINAFFFVLLLGIGILVIFQDLTNIRGL